MKNHLIPLCATAAMCAAAQAIIIDGDLDASGYTSRSVQTITGGWGANNVLANLQTSQTGANLAVFLGGRASGNAIILFIDSKAGGLTFVPNNLIVTGGEESTLNNLGSSASAGMAFESGFAPDYAIRIYGTGSNAYVNRYDLQSGVRTYVGECGSGTVAPSGFVSAAKAQWVDVSTAYADVTKGVELSLSLAGMGVPSGTAQPVKMMAILVNDASNYGSNQTLGSKSGSADLGSGITGFSFEADSGTQTISFTVDNTDTDGDGIPDVTDTDDDGDGLPDSVETNTGIFVDAMDTGSDPMVKDTDGDGADDGAEVNGAAVVDGGFGFVSNPDTATYFEMAAPGGYTTPTWQETGAGGCEMTRAGTSLAQQNQWTLNYNFRTRGGIEYKFAANNAWIHNWGDGGGNFTSVVNGTGFHTFTFSDETGVRAFNRTVFPDLASYLAAYGLTGQTGTDDPDGDGLDNDGEFAINTDPTAADTDGDGVNDNTDTSPLLSTRDIVFSVNMNVQTALGLFTPGTDSVVVDFFDGEAGAIGDLTLSDSDNDGIWTGTLSGISGPAGIVYGTYKFRTNHAGAPSNGYEGAIGNRTLTLTSPSPETLATVYFNDAGPGYAGWAAQYAGGQAADADYDGDGIKNVIEYFMGTSTPGFTTNPAPVNGAVTWPRNTTASGLTFKVLQSSDLVNWTDVTSQADVSSAGQVLYTLPTGAGKLFVRLEVISN